MNKKSTDRVTSSRFWLYVRNVVLFLVLFMFTTCTSFVLPEFEYDDIRNYNEYDFTVFPLLFDAGIYPYVEVEIQGKMFAFHIDTGDEISNLSLTEAQMNELDFEYTDIMYRTSDMEGNVFTKYLFQLPDVQLGDYYLDSILCTESMYRAAPYLMDIGVIGWHLLKKFNIYINYANNQLAMYHVDHYPEGLGVFGWSRIELSSDRSLAFSAKMPGYDKELRIGIDTGSIMIGSTVDDCTVMNLLRVEVPENVIDQYGTTYFGGNSDFPIIHGVSIVSGGTAIDDLLFLYYQTAGPRNLEGFLGGDFFRKYEVFIDYANGFMYFRPN